MEELENKSEDGGRDSVMLKRKALTSLEPPDESSGQKKAKLEVKNGELNLLMFSDDILLMIITHLNHSSVLNLSKTCFRLNGICQDHTLWREVHFGPHQVKASELDEMLKYVSNETKSIHVKGSYVMGAPTEEVLDAAWLSQVNEKCQNLTKLGVPSHNIDCRFIYIHQFPKTLKWLDMSGTYLHNVPCCRSYFRDISILMPELETLILSNCQWFEPHSLMALSKCPKLTELRLDGCNKMKDCVAYCGLATRGGFRSLKTLDLRKSPVGCSELICFASVTSIVNLYLENPYIDNQYPHIDTPIMVLCTNEPLIEIRADGNRNKINFPRLKIQKLIVRNYRQMTDTSLRRLARDANCLRYLDVTGCGITLEGVQRFKSLRPSVTVICDEIAQQAGGVG